MRSGFGSATLTWHKKIQTYGYTRLRKRVEFAPSPNINCDAKQHKRKATPNSFLFPFFPSPPTPAIPSSHSDLNPWRGGPSSGSTPLPAATTLPSPPPKWQSQRILRPIKFDPFPALPGLLPRPRNGLPLPPCPLADLVKKLQKLPPLVIDAGDRPEIVREKLLSRLSDVCPTGVVPDVAATEASPEKPGSGSSGIEEGGACEVLAGLSGCGCEERKAESGGFLPPVAEGRPKSLRLRGMAPERFDFSKEVPRISFSLTRRQIEDDFLEMMGSKPSRRPKKRAKCVQKALDEIFPGLQLSNITLDSYKVW